MSNLEFWCDGLKGEEDVTQSSSTSKKRKVNEEDVQKTGDDLKKKHELAYTSVQYSIWAEMISGSLHSDLDNLPSTQITG